MNSEKDISHSSQRRPLTSRSPVSTAEVRKIDAIALVVLMGLSGVGYLLGVSPLLERHALARNQQAELTLARQKSAEAQNELVSAQQQLMNAQHDLKASPLHLQPGTMLNQRLALVTELTAQGGAGLDDLLPGKSAQGTQYDTMPVHLAGKGSFPVFAALLHRLRREFPDTAINTFDISVPPQDATGNATFSIDLLWFTESVKRNGKALEKPEEAAGHPGQK